MIPHKENSDEWTWSAYCNDFEKINKQQMYIMFANLQIETHKNAYIVTNTCKQKKNVFCSKYTVECIGNSAVLYLIQLLHVLLKKGKL